MLDGSEVFAFDSEWFVGHWYVCILTIYYSGLNQTQMAFIPEPAWGTIMSYLHDEYDWEKKAVIDELNQKCAVFGGDECILDEQTA